MAVTRHAPAKLNLALHITGKRADGYHLLESLVAFTAWSDMLTFEAADTLSLTVTGEFAPAAGGEEDNLVMRAAQLLQQVSGTQKGARITLEKNIPVGAGLGGGSADAAATLQALNDLWILGYDARTLLALAPQLGADVAMCLVGQPLIARGVGEIVEPLSEPLPLLSVVLVHPRAPLLTAQVYAMLDATNGSGLPPFSGDLLPWLASTRNDLQRPAIAATPIVAEVLLAMETAAPRADFVRMTGSGACCFALFSDADRAASYAAQLRLQHPQWWVIVTPLSR